MRGVINNGKEESPQTWKEQGLVFANAYGGFIEPDYARLKFQRMLSKVGLPHMRFHDLRHSAATILLAMGVDLKVIQGLMGHSTLAMTADIYAHLLPSMQQDAIERLEKRFGGKLEDGHTDEQEED